MNKEYRAVSEEEFREFLDKYPRELDRDVAHFFEPPLVTYNDFALGNWPDSVVAHCKAERPGEYFNFRVLDEANIHEAIKNRQAILDAMSHTHNEKDTNSRNGDGH